MFASNIRILKVRQNNPYLCFLDEARQTDNLTVQWQVTYFVTPSIHSIFPMIVNRCDVKSVASLLFLVYFSSSLARLSLFIVKMRTFHAYDFLKVVGETALRSREASVQLFLTASRMTSN